MDVEALTKRLLVKTTLNLSDVEQIRAYLDQDSILHHEAADALAALSARVAELERERDSWREQFYAASNAASEYVGFWERHHGDFDAAGNYIPYSQMDGDLRAAEARATALAAEVERYRAKFGDLP